MRWLPPKENTPHRISIEYTSLHAQVTELSLSDKDTAKLDVKIATELLSEAVQNSTSLELRREGNSARLERQNIKGIEFTKDTKCVFGSPTERRLLFGPTPQAGVCVPI